MIERFSLKSKSFRAAIIIFAAVVSGVASVFACGPDFPNNLLDGGDAAVLQAPHADFQHELELMAPVKTSIRALPPAAGRTFRDQAAEAELSDLAAALKQSGVSVAQATAILTEHLHQRAKLKAFQDRYLAWRSDFNQWKEEYPWRTSVWITAPAPDPKAINELLYNVYVQSLPAFVHLAGTEQQSFRCAGLSSAETIPGIPDANIGWDDWDDRDGYFVKNNVPVRGVTIPGRLDNAIIIGWLRTNPPPVITEVLVTPGLPVEFAYYFRGIIAQARGGPYSDENSQERLAPWRRTTTDWYQAERLLERLLELPEKERHFKSTWAAFMLGRMHEEEADFHRQQFSESVVTNDFVIAQATNNISYHYGEAARYYQLVRELARRGFADSTGLAASSLGLEARVCLDQNIYESAIELYLEQKAAGDNSALNSLRFTAAAVFRKPGASPEQFAALARNSRSRRVLASYLISYRLPWMFADYSAENSDRYSEQRMASAWLGAMESAGIQDGECASQFALAAYQAGRMDLAQRWINRAGNEPVAQWLQAKLLMRDGNITAAAKILARVSRQFPPALLETNPPKTYAAGLSVDVSGYEHEYISAGQQALGELGVLHLARREYAEALDALLRSSYWMDAAYVAERVMTADELKHYVDRNWPPVSGVRREPAYVDHYSYGDDQPTLRQKIRYLLARRLAREARYAEARRYIPRDWLRSLDALVAELKVGRDASVPIMKRVDALMAAAAITRTNGMELTGTELAPDWFIEAGNFEQGVTWKGRMESLTNSIINVASRDELERGRSHHAEPEVRWHYRDLAQKLKIEAADLIWEAAKLMPDNTDELARLLVRGGMIRKWYDAPAADKYYKALVHRCGKTLIGQQADKLRWFPELDENGNLIHVIPWIDEMEPTPELMRPVIVDGVVMDFYKFPVPGNKYRVQPGDTLTRIARAASKLGGPVTVQQLMDANPGVIPAKLHVGRELAIPGTAVGMPATNSAAIDLKLPDQSVTKYIVHDGDTLMGIAKHLGVSVRSLTEANRLDPKLLKVGQKLEIPRNSRETNPPSAP